MMQTDILATPFLALALVVLARSDLRERRLPDRITVPLLLAGLVLALWRDPATMGAHVTGAVSAYTVFALIGHIKPRGKFTLEQARKVEVLKEGSPAFTTMRRLAMRFNGILRGRKADPLPAWIDDAIEMEWSNGQAEGQINRLKTLKRAMYGRAGPNLLRARMLPLHHTN